MRIRNGFIILIATMTTLFSCNVRKTSFTISGNRDMAIEVAINDFVRNSKLSHKDSVFMVKIYHEDSMTIVTTISGLRGNKFWVYRDVEIGKPHKGLVTRYKIVNGKLFAWRDSTGIVTKNLLKVLSSYNALDSSMITDPYCVFPPYTIDELAKAASYYFSKQNIKIFKVQETSVAPLIGLRQPKLDYGNRMKRNPKIDSIYYGWRNYVKSLKRKDKQ